MAIKLRPAQALMELAVGLFTLALVISDPEGVREDVTLCEIDNLAVAKKEQGWPDPADVTGKTPEEAFGDKVQIPEALASTDASLISAWGKKWEVAFEPGTEVLEDAFLLNCENTEAAINAAKENFKATSITIDSDGKVTVGTPEGTYNGTIKTLGKAALSDAEWSEDLAGKKFFELKLVPTNLN